MGWKLVVAVGAVSLICATPAAADDASGYVVALENTNLIDHDGDQLNCTEGPCYPQFEDADAAVVTGRWVCDQKAGGKSRALLIDWLSHGEGLMPSPHNAPIIVDAAFAFLCP